MELVESTYGITRTFPADERFGLASQMRRASVSIASNIAEGHARSLGDYVRYVGISLGSLRELETQIELGLRVGLIPQAEGAPVLQRCDDLGRMLWALAKKLTTRRASVGRSEPGTGVRAPGLRL